MDHLSASQINLYLLCSLKYRFQYVDELPKPFRPSALAFGSAFHSALSWLHKQQTAGRDGVTLDRLWRIFEADWYAQRLDTEILYKPNETEVALAGLGREFLRLHFARPGVNIKGSEIHFTVPLRDPEDGRTLSVNLEGFIDLVEADDTIVEFKTSAQTMNARDAHTHLQLTAYSYAYEMLYHRPAKALKIVDFVKSRRPKMVVLETTRTANDHQRFFCLAGQVLNAIQSRIFFPRTGYWCGDCEYAQPCKAWKGS